MVSVQDNGIGIAPEMLPQALRDVLAGRARAGALARAGSASACRSRSGLVALHGGSIEAQQRGPRPGQRIRRAPAAGARGARTATPRAAGSAMPVAAATAALRVLVADDNRDTADSLRDAAAAWRATTCARAYDGSRGAGDRRRIPAAHRAARHRHARDERLRGRAPHPRDGLGRRRWRSSRSPAGDRTKTGGAEAAGFDHHRAKPVHFESLEPLFAKCALDAQAKVTHRVPSKPLAGRSC